jgi:hypothetical protein
VRACSRSPVSQRQQEERSGVRLAPGSLPGKSPLQRDVSTGRQCQQVMSGAPTVPQVHSLPVMRVERTCQVRHSPSWFWTFSASPRALCSAESSRGCQASAGESGPTPRLITPQQGKNWLCKAMAGKVIMAGWGQDRLRVPASSSSALSSAVTYKFTKMKSFPSHGCKKSAM